jgi:hypothetical protein
MPSNPKPKTEFLMPPQTLRIGPYDIKVINWDRLAASASERLGEFSSMELCIRVDFASYSPLFSAGVLLHEINHALYWHYGVDDKDGEERICGMMANGWLQVWRDNPSLLKWIAWATGK